MAVSSATTVSVTSSTATSAGADGTVEACLERPTSDAVGGHPDEAVRTPPVAVDERGHHQVARGDAVEFIGIVEDVGAEVPEV
jgi:hypothetical protein